ncbi:microtubule-associated protein, putative, partial [Leishmania donovani]
MSGAVATFTNPRLLERPVNERTEYEDAYQWRGLPEKPQDTQEDINSTNPCVDPAMYNTTTK